MNHMSNALAPKTRPLPLVELGRVRALADARTHARGWVAQYRSEIAYARKHAASPNEKTSAHAVEVGLRAITVTGPYALQMWRRARAMRGGL